MDVLIESTLRYGLVPLVVMEYPGITAGGGFAGTAGESSSFRYGFFDRTITWIEIVLANGNIETASTTKNPELLYGAAASFGTLGITTLLRITLREAKSHVELTYWPISSMTQALAKIEKLTSDPKTDYVDGILYAADRGVICSGSLRDASDSTVQRFSRGKDPWFYLHARKLTNGTSTPVTEFVPLVDYLFRYDRGAFWMGWYAFRYFLTPFNRVTRRILNQFMHTRTMYRALHKSGHSKQYIIQDVAVPYSAAGEFLDYVDENIGHYPLWLCPFNPGGESPEAPVGLLAEKATSKTPEMLLNFGVWGPGPSDRREFVEVNRRLEHKIKDLKGSKWLYAHTYFTEEEFWSMYDRESYDVLRSKYSATYLPNIYDKVKVDVEAEEKAIRESWTVWLLAVFWSIWPLSGLYGVYKAAIGGDYLLPREATSLWGSYWYLGSLSKDE